MKKIRILCILCILALAVVQYAPAVVAEEYTPVTVEGIAEISKFGNLKLKASHMDILTYFEFGDILTVSFGGKTVDVPLCVNFSDVDSGKAGLFLQGAGETQTVELGINMGNFAETYGIAQKIVFPDKTYKWNYTHGFSANTVFRLTMKLKNGYLDQYNIRNMSYTDMREDYPHLTDEEFANFRMVKMGFIGDAVLYRGASSVNPEHNRNTYADIACRNAGVTVFVSLDDNEETLISYPNYRETYYATKPHIAVAETADPTADENMEKIAECLRFMANNPGVYNIQCKEGKDRTGFFVALLGCLMGATLEEIINDYMVSFYNYYGIKPADSAYGIIANGNIINTLKNAFQLRTLEGANLYDAALDYMERLNLTPDEVEAIRQNLLLRPENLPPPQTNTAPAVSFADVPQDAYYRDAVNWAVLQNITKGITETEFRPEMKVSRAQAITFLHRMAGSPTPGVKIAFLDVPAGHYSENAIAWGVSNRIATGMSESQFMPDRDITREQIVTMLYRYAKLIGKDVSVNAETMPVFQDWELVSDYAAEPLIWAVEKQIITGRDGDLFAPQETANRGELVTILMRFYNLK